MQGTRRNLLRLGWSMGLLAAFGAALVRPGRALAAWNKGAFEAKTVAEGMQALGISGAVESKDLVIRAPDIAENGAVVPFTIQSKIPKTESIALLVEKNPNILVASFSIPDGTEPWVNTRAKMGQTSNVFAVVKADGKYYYAAKEVKVTIGGCGG